MDDYAPDFSWAYPPPDGVYSRPPRPPFPPPPFYPSPPTPRPYDQHGWSKYSNLIVLGCGITALVIVYWKCHRKGSKGMVTPSPNRTAPSSPNNFVESFEVPPPPYTPSFSPRCYEKPPPYNGLNPKPEEQLGSTRETVQNEGGCHSETVAETINPSPGIHVINVREVKV